MCLFLKKSVCQVPTNTVKFSFSHFKNNFGFNLMSLFLVPNVNFLLKILTRQANVLRYE